MTDSVIKLKNVSKRYRLGQIGYRSLREDIANLIKGRSDTAGSFDALLDVSFEVGKGEAVGIIGPNGAGKSSILKLLANVTKPSSGTLTVLGKVGALIELSAGFHAELTGRENIYLYGSIIGLKRSRLDAQFASIVAFSGLERFMDTPIKRYSSGMHARLGFAVSAHLDPDILLVDEVLSVGDHAFQEKCIAKMREFRDAKKTIVFVSHNLESVRKLCDRVILLERGQVAFDGDAQSAINRYHESYARGQMSQNGSSGAIQLMNKQLLNSAGLPCVGIESLEQIVVDLQFGNCKRLRGVYFSIFVRQANGSVVYDTSSDLLNGEHYVCQPGQPLAARFELRVNLLKGTYLIGCNIHGSIEDEPAGCLFYDNALFSFNVMDESSHQGVANLEARCAIDGATARGPVGVSLR